MIRRRPRPQARGIALGFCLALLPQMAIAGESVCFGSPELGRITDAVKLPSSGSNFRSYGFVPELAGRTYVHTVVRDITVETYRRLEKKLPTTTYVYGETGLSEGGKFRPHKTHQNGTSVDFMVPVLNRAGHSVPLPTSVFNKYGYGIEFDSTGRYNEYTIDFDAIASHLMVLYAVAEERGIRIRRVIFDAPLVKRLKEVSMHSALSKVHFQEEKPWIRHDEHYHVDFLVPCSP